MKQLLKIAVVGDDNTVCRQIQEYFRVISRENCMKISVCKFISGSDFLEELEKHRDLDGFDIIFLDIEMPDKSGLDIGHYIRQELKDDIQQIVYISAYEQYSLSLHKFHPLDFLIKEIQLSDVKEVFDRFLNMERIQEDFYYYKVGRDIQRVKASKIRYLKADNREITIFLDGSDNDSYNKNSNNKLQYLSYT